MEANIPTLQEVDTLLFVDETKFYVNNGNNEDAIFYFAIAVDKSTVPSVIRDINEALRKSKFRGKQFHATTVFKEMRPRAQLMNELTDIFISYNLHGFYYRYSKNLLFERTKILEKYNNDVNRFDEVEFQALFYFLLSLNVYLRVNPKLLKGSEFIMYGDRNVYGVGEPEAFVSAHEDWCIKRMTYCNKDLINLLCLPDYFGYIFRRTKLNRDLLVESQNIEYTSELAQNCEHALTGLSNQGLLHNLNSKDEAEILRVIFQL